MRRWSHIEPALDTLAPGYRRRRTHSGARRGPAAPPGEQGWLHCGKSGSGHYVKMIHNGIEYGMMQAMAEGFALFASARNEVVAEDYRYELDLAAIAEVWRRGSVVSSWLLDLGADALAANPSLDLYSPEVADSGEGRWTIEAAIDQRRSAQVLAAALFARFDSRDADQLGNRFLSALRNKFGGHPSLSGKGLNRQVADLFRHRLAHSAQPLPFRAEVAAIGRSRRKRGQIWSGQPCGLPGAKEAFGAVTGKGLPD